MKHPNNADTWTNKQHAETKGTLVYQRVDIKSLFKANGMQKVTMQALINHFS